MTETRPMTRFGRFHRRMILPSEEGARVTMFELFFDLVFVFAFTQVSRLMADGHSGESVLQALIVLALLWWSWVGYTWLANQTRADQGIIRVGFIVATIANFVIALSVPEVFHDLPGGLAAPYVLIVAYLIARLIHGTLYLLASGMDRDLRRQILVTVPAAVIPSAVLLFVGAGLGAPYQTWFWMAALVLDVVVTYATSRIGWRVHSAVHWSERHGLIVILALGESIVSIGAGAARLPISMPIVAGAALAVLLAFALWWAYFERMAAEAEHVLAHHEGRPRAALARDAYTYLHFPLIAGIILGALGIEVAIAHAAEPEAFGMFGAGALCAGVALYLVSTAAFWGRMVRRVAWSRLIAAAGILLLTPVAASLPSLGGLAVVVAALGLLVAGEFLWQKRREAQVSELTAQGAG
jgi:low temperature requirement protein LtrA